MVATAKKSKLDGSLHWRRRRGRRSPVFRCLPRWGVLAGCAVAVVAYLVVLYCFFVSPLSFRWRAIFGECDYPQGYDIQGIDISHYQENIRWDALRGSVVNGRPLRFVIVKATEGVTLVDGDFHDNFRLARENGLLRGAYHFFIPDSAATRQAEFYLGQACLEAGDLPPILDIERRGDLPLPEFQDSVRAWLTAVRSVYGVLPVIYTNLDFKKNHLSDPSFDPYPLWIANYYQKELKYDGAWKLWQYTDLGTVDGIRHVVDFNLFNGGEQELRDFLIPENDSTRCGYML